ncbi:Alpha/beta-hydrolase [Favolaschia claudopus]|uniref:Alpha/beta-hydrolase n=1 Tax=Favolaschia claudopus TaxID=2862362 RepID=A0AAW0AJR5_9AGAR
MVTALQPTSQTYVPTLNIESFILPSPPTPTGKPLSIAAKRYTAPGAIQSVGITLVMFHGLGQHKEQWEPTLEKLFAIHSSSRSNSNLPQIREAWALDWQSHGESAVLNQNSLQDDAESAPLNLWGIAIANFLKSNHVAGHRLYGVGYSSGTVGLLLSTRDSDFDFANKCPYNGIILVEPSMMDEDTWKASGEDEIQPAFDMVTNAVKHRRDVWATREAALKFFMGRFPWNAWDPRIVALFAEHALTSGKDKEGKPCVVRSCPMIHEALAFQVNLKNTWDAVEQISKLSPRVPIHVVFGETVDLMPQVIHECVVDKSKGRNVASITTIPDVGHTIMQEMPDVVATTVSDLLNKLCSPPVRSLLRLQCAAFCSCS